MFVSNNCQYLVPSMSVQSASSIVDTYGLDPFSVDHILSIFESQGVFSNGKDNAESIAKFVNRIISAAEQNGGDSVSSCCRILRSIAKNGSVAHLEKCAVRILDFSKSAILYCPEFGTKNDGRRR